jgi:hypothetical protein
MMDADADYPEPERVNVVNRGPCGKSMFRSESAAKIGRKRMDGYGRGHGYKGRAHAYFCRECKAWHVGHNE